MPLRLRGRLGMMIACAGLGAGCDGSSSVSASSDKSSGRFESHSDYNRTISDCINVSALSSFWKVGPIEHGALRMTATTSALGLPSAGSEVQQPADFEVSVSWPFEPDGLPMGYLLAQPERLREAVRSGVTKETGRILRDAEGRWALIERLTGSVPSYVDFENRVQCKTSSLETPDGRSANGVCQLIGRDGAYSAGFYLPQGAVPELPRLLSLIADEIQAAFASCEIEQKSPS